MKRDDRNSEPLDAILRRAAARPPGPATPECADPEMLAAYYDRSLVQSERERLEAHLADCARCQMQLAAISRSDERANDAGPAFGIAWMRQRWRIAIPVLAAAAALLVVVRAMRPSTEVRHGEQLAMAKHEAPLPELAAPASAPAAQVASAPQPATNELAMNNAKRAEPSGMHQMEQREAHRAAAPLAYAPAGKAQLPAAASEARSAALASGMHPSVPKSRAPENEPTTNASGAAYARSNAGGGSAIGAAGAAPETLVMISPPERPAMQTQTTNPSAGVAASGAPIVGSTIGRAMSAGVGALVANSMGQRGPTWMAGKRGTILFRDANGTTRPQYSGVEADLTAGAAPSETVCWIVGRSGTIIRTTDGENWTKIASPTNADLFAIVADSAEHAIVTTVTAKNFETSDGGTSWHPQ